MSQETPKKTEENYPLEDINNKSDETTPLTQTGVDNAAENNVNNEASGIEEKLSLEKNDTEAAQTSKRKSITAAIIAAEDILENPKIRLILAVVCAILLFLFVLVLAIIIIASESDDDKTHRFIRIIPRPKGPYNLLYYRHGDLKEESGIRSWIDMVEEIDAFLAPYRRPENATLCPFSSRNASAKHDTVCLFDLNTIAKECLKSDYGYMAGRPCIYIVFNNISDWIPESDSQSNSANQVAPRIVGLDCTANTQFDAENVGPMEFTPYQGFSPIYFPYHGQANYMAPFVALRLPAPTHNVGIGLTCRLVTSANETESATESTNNEPLPFIPFNIFIE